MKKGILQFYDLLQLVCLEAVEEEEQEEEDVGAPPAHHPAAWDYPGQAAPTIPTLQLVGSTTQQ